MEPANFTFVILKSIRKKVTTEMSKHAIFKEDGQYAQWEIELLYEYHNDFTVIAFQHRENSFNPGVTHALNVRPKNEHITVAEIECRLENDNPGRHRLYKNFYSQTELPGVTYISNGGVAYNTARPLDAVSGGIDTGYGPVKIGNLWPMPTVKELIG